MNLKQKANENKKQQIFDYIFKFLGKDIMNYQLDNFSQLSGAISDKFKVSKTESINFIKDFKLINPLTDKIISNFDLLYKDVLDYEKLLKTKNFPIDEKFFNSLVKKITTSEPYSDSYIKGMLFFLYFSNKYDFEGDGIIDVKAVK